MLIGPNAGWGKLGGSDWFHFFFYFFILFLQVIHDYILTPLPSKWNHEMIGSIDFQALFYTFTNVYVHVQFCGLVWFGWGLVWFCVNGIVALATFGQLASFHLTKSHGYVSTHGQICPTVFSCCIAFRIVFKYRSLLTAPPLVSIQTVSSLFVCLLLL